MMTSSLHSPSRTGLRTRALRATATGLCLTSCLTGLVACSSDDDGAGGSSSATQSSGGVLSEATERPSIAESNPSPKPSREPGAVSDNPSGATVQPTASWTPPEVHFYNENWAYWYQDDSVTNQDSITSKGNLEGFRTYAGSCMGFATRDINEATHFAGISDEELSAHLLDGSAGMNSFEETERERVSLVTDEGGTLEGYNITYTGNYTWAEGPTDVRGYRFARTVGDAGLNFVVMIMCESGDELTLDQWHEILAGIRLTGVSGGSMDE